MNRLVALAATGLLASAVKLTSMRGDGPPQACVDAGCEDRECCDAVMKELGIEKPKKEMPQACVDAECEDKECCDAVMKELGIEKPPRKEESEAAQQDEEE